MPNSTIEHASFRVERLLNAPTEKVFEAFSNKTAKERWFKGPNNTAAQHEMHFTVGGEETNTAKFQGVTHRFVAHYYDIVPNERIIYTYEMFLNDRRISVSLCSIEFVAVGSQTKLTLIEDGAFLDRLDSVTSRQQGTEDLLSKLEQSLV